MSKLDRNPPVKGPKIVKLKTKRDKRLSWEDTFKAMAGEREDWSAFEATVADGHVTTDNSPDPRERRTRRERGA